MSQPSVPNPDSTTPKTARSGRSGGREARRALRAAPLAEDLRPVVPGMESGNYKILSDADMQKVHKSALKVLSEIGIADAIPTCVEALTAAGAEYGDDGRMRFPTSMIEDLLPKINRSFTLCGQDPKHDMHPQGSRTYFGTAGAAVHTVDGVTGEYRESLLSDLYDMARIVDKMEHIHFFQRTIVPRDLPDPYEMDINTLYAALRGTSKHVGSSFVSAEHAQKGLELVHHIAGSEAKWRERPFVSQSNCFVVPPLKFAEDASGALEVAARGGMPVLLLSAGQAGATAPAALAGALVQEVAEVLAGFAYVNAVAPGAPAMFGTWPFVSDLRTGAMSGGSGEQALLMSACAQMGRFYELPTGVCAGMADSKVPDAQAGYEKGYNHALVGNSGANMVYESAGMHASLLGCCMESLIIDSESLGATQRTIKGIEITEDSLSIDTIRQVCTEGPGHYLGHEQTISRMEREYLYPVVGDRTSPKEWIEQGSTTILDRAVALRDKILSTHYPDHVSGEVDAKIRADFPIRLPVEKTLPSA